MMKESDITLGPGLDESEIDAAEAVLGCRFPADLRCLLGEALPSGAGFPDWRRPLSEGTRRALAGPVEGLCEGAEHGWWWPRWGRRPDDPARVRGIVRARLAGVPRLIPIHGHRYLPAEPSLPGNPVFSVFRTDTLLCGADLRHYLAREFGTAEPGEPPPAAPRPIRFWSDLAMASSGREAWQT